MKRIWFLLTFLFLAAQAEAATYWVSQASSPPGPHCNNSATDPGPTGSSLTVAQALTCMTNAGGGGHTVYIKGGTYNETGLLVPSGTAGAYNTVASYSNESVVFTSTSGTFNFYNTAKQYVNIVGGCDVGTNRNCRMTFDASPMAFDHVERGGSQFITFDGIRIHNVETGGVLPGGGIAVNIGSNNITFKNCRMDHNGAKTLSDQGQPGYGYYIGGDNNTVENCEIDNNGGFGIHQYSSDQNPSNNTYRFNIIHDNGQNHIPTNSADGILMTGNDPSVSTNNQAYGNVIYGHAWGYGIRSNHANAIIYNNTVYNNGFGDGGSTGLLIEGINPTVRNNIVSANAAGQILQLGGAAGTFSNNLCGPGTCTVGSNNQNESAATTFTNAGAGDFTLRAGSAAINNGTINIALGVNISACSGGTTVGCYNGTFPDIGALETGVPTVAGGPPTLTANLSSVQAGQEIKVTVDDDDVNERIENTGDWVGIFVAGTTAGSIDWFYMNGSKVAPSSPISDAVLTFTAPTTVGAYEFRFYRNNSVLEVDRLATAAFTVIAPGIVMRFNITSLKIGPSVTWKIGTP